MTPEIDAHAVTHQQVAVKLLSDHDGGVDIVEGDNYAPKGFKWRPGVDGCMRVNEVADGY